MGSLSGISLVLLLAAAIGLAVGFLVSGPADVSSLAGAVFGLLGATLACIVISDVVHGAKGREGGGSRALGFMVSLAALFVVGLTIVFHYFSLLVVAGLIWLAVSRRRRAQRKHAGLRVLR